MLISVNGEITLPEKAVIPALDRGFLYGDSVYEATRTFQRKVFRLDEHLNRLHESAKLLHLPLYLTDQEITKFINDLVTKHPAENVTLRIQISRGTNTVLGLDSKNVLKKNNIVIFASTLTPNPDSWLSQGIKLCTFDLSFMKTGAQSKAGTYVENILAYEKARNLNVDDAILVDPESRVLEGTTSNFWLIDDKNEILTPPLEVGILNGLTRQTLIKIFKAKGYIVREKVIKKQELTKASEVFITSTSRFLVPVVEIDAKKIGSGAPGKLTMELLQIYLDELRKDYHI